MKQIKLFILISIVMNTLSCQSQEPKKIEIEYKKAFVSYSDYANLVKIVKEVRSEKLISFDQLLQFQQKKKTIILDTRSENNYKGKHIKGAINLPFTEFTQSRLREIIPDTSTRIIIYCNNNFEGDDKYLPSKLFIPNVGTDKRISNDQKSIMLPLNIPTYINLYGYGYRNIYELNELLDINDPRIIFEGNDPFLR